MDLFSDDLAIREAASRDFNTFSKPIDIPKKYAEYWRDIKSGSNDWPEQMKLIASLKQWPKHAFGSANAGLVIFWHRPGLGSGNLTAGDYIGPRLPVLGGNGHAHLKHWHSLHKSPSCKLLFKYIPKALEDLGLKDVWSQVMLACINPAPGPTGAVDLEANKRSAQCGGAMDTVVKLCKPRLILLCGGDVQKVGPLFQKLHSNVSVLRVPHPATWEGYCNPAIKGPEIAIKIQRALGNSGAKVIIDNIISEPNAPLSPKISKSKNSPDFSDMIKRVKVDFLRKFVEFLRNSIPVDCEISRVKKMWVVKHARKTIFEIHPRDDFLVFAIRKPRGGDLNKISKCGHLMSDRSMTKSHPYITFQITDECNIQETKRLIQSLVARERIQ